MKLEFLLFCGVYEFGRLSCGLCISKAWFVMYDVAVYKDRKRERKRRVICCFSVKYTEREPHVNRMYDNSFLM